MMSRKVKPNIKSSFIAFKATPSFKAKMDEIAKIEGKKTSVLIREAIEAKIRYSEALQGVKAPE